MGVEWVTVAGVADKAGVIVLLFFILVSGVKKWWVFGWVYRESEERSKEWRDLALTGTRIAEHMAVRAKDDKAAIETAGRRSRRREADA